MPRIIDQSPSPKSHVKTLMRIGYTLNSAVADIIDNSLAAGAKVIQVIAPPGIDEPTLSIVDDGCGMDLKELTENMRIGCKDPDANRERGDLGRFGSGMKTASFSQARRLTVVSRREGQPLVAARWDIDKVEETDSWCLEVFDEHEIGQLTTSSGTLLANSGTQIIWSKLTCLDIGGHPTARDAELATRLAELKSYIALHFHRFMSGPDKRIFSLNNLPILPVDPFMTGQRGYQEGPSEKLRCTGGHIVIQTHVLPHFRNMKRERLEELGGADGITQQQGLYIYREKRLISAGGWLGMGRTSQLGALARVQVDIPSALDHEWSTDVKKSSLQIPPRVKRELRKFLADPVKRSRRIHRYRGRQDAANNFWSICEDESSGTISYEIDAENEQLVSLVATCEGNQRRLLVDYLKALAASLPINHIYEKMAERPRDVSQETADMAKLEALLNKVFES